MLRQGKEWGWWLSRRIIELSIFALVYTALSILRSEGGWGEHYIYNIKIILMFIFIYSIVFLYVPISATLFNFLKSDKLKCSFADSIFFIVHSGVSLSVMYSQFLFSIDLAEYAATEVLSWLAVVLFHLASVAIWVLSE